MFRRAIAALFALAFLAPTAAAAQQEASAVLVVDWERALGESMAGQDILRQRVELQERVRVEVQRHESEIGAEEAEIASQRGVLGAVEFEERVRDFEEKVDQLRAYVQAQDEAIKRAFERALGMLAGDALQALGDVMRETGATHVLDRRVVLAHSTSEATDLLIERLNERVQQIALDYEPPEVE